MTKDQYLRMVEQTGEEIDWDRCPPDIEDFPESILTAINIYNSLGDRIYPDIGFVGKDFTNLSLLYDLYLIKEHEKDWLFELLLLDLPLLLFLLFLKPFELLLKLCCLL